MVGVTQTERRGKSVLGNQLSGGKGLKAEDAGRFGDPGKKPAWLGEVCSGRGGAGSPPQAGLLGSHKPESSDCLLVSRLMKENLEVMLLLLILDFLLKCFSGKDLKT